MYLASKFFGFILTPSALIIAILAVGLFFQGIGRKRLGGGLTNSGVVIVLAISVLPVGKWLLNPLENRFSRPEKALARVDGIIVLGGTIDLPTSLDRGQFVLKKGAEVFIETAYLTHRYPNARVVFSGGGVRSEGAQRTEAVIAREIFSALNIDPRRVRYEDRSRNTRENAVFGKVVAQPRPGEVWVLIAPASDMPRDVGCFRAVGWPIVAWPTGYRTLDNRHFYSLMTSDVADIDLATHEWLGLLYYRLRGWTDSLFP